jgi:hypothetical protein
MNGRIVNSGMGGFLRPPTHPIAAASAKLQSWQPLPIDSPRVQGWILQVLGYFIDANCWSGDGKLVGVSFIQNYYPDFVPSDEHFDNACWTSQQPA